MSRWTVYKAGRYAWTAHREGDLPSELFPTWRMALDYADRMARTREVVLPRPNLDENEKVEFDFTEWAGLDYWPEWADAAIYDRRTGPNMPAFGATVIIPREHWKPLANALHALAEQEEQCEK